jgi:hypothetical protein
MHRRSVVLSYLRGWFLPDLAGSLPYDLMLESRGFQTYGVPKFLRILRIFKLMRLLRIFTMLRYANRLALPFVRYLQGTVGRFVFLICFAVTMGHWGALLYYWSNAVAGEC